MHSTRTRSPRRHVANAIVATAAGLTLAGGCSAAVVSAVGPAGEQNPKPGTAGSAQAYQAPRDGDDRADRRTRAGPPDTGTKEEGFEVVEPKAKPRKSEPEKSGLPSGQSTATSFWDPETASGKPMSFRTLASPYWPLGTKVKITYQGKTAVGVVDDFGPAEWAVAQHDPPALVDLSEKMMERFTGSRQDVVQVKFEVLEMGDGRSYRQSGTGHDAAMGR